jgi:hypothetical protein
MRRLAIASLLLIAAACATPRPGTGSTSSLPGHGAISIQIIPNPIVARRVSGNTYDFPFEVVVRETGGRTVNVDRVSADVYAVGGIHVASESYSAADIRNLGYPTTLAANSEVRYRFTPRKSVGDERLFGGVYAELHVDATDDTGTPTRATTTVTVTR